MKKMNKKSKFLSRLDEVLKEVEVPIINAYGSTNTNKAKSPEEVEKQGQAVANIAQTAGNKNAEAIAAANQALLAAIQTHPELAGDFSRLTPDFIQKLNQK